MAKNDVFGVGDRVIVTNANSVNFGRMGYIEKRDRSRKNGAYYDVRFSDRVVALSPKSFRVQKTYEEQHFSTKGYVAPAYVLLWNTMDGELQIDSNTFVDITWDHCMTSHDIAEVRYSIKEDLESWDIVFGLLNGKPFVARKRTVIDGIDLELD